MIVAPQWLVTDYYLAKATGRPWYDPVMAQVIAPHNAHTSKKSSIGAVVLIRDMTLAGVLFEMWHYDVALGMLDAYEDDYELKRSSLCAGLSRAETALKERTRDESTIKYYQTAMMLRINRTNDKYQPPLRSSDYPEIKRVWTELAILCPEVAANLSTISGGKKELNRQDVAQARKDIGALASVTRPGKELEFINAMVDVLAPKMFVRAAHGTLTLKTQQPANDDRHAQPISGIALAARQVDDCGPGCETNRGRGAHKILAHQRDRKSITQRSLA